SLAGCWKQCAARAGNPWQAVRTRKKDTNNNNNNNNNSNTNNNNNSNNSNNNNKNNNNNNNNNNDNKNSNNNICVGSRVSCSSSNGDHQASIRSSQPDRCPENNNNKNNNNDNNKNNNNRSSQPYQCSEQLNSLLALGPTATEAEVSSALQARLDRWRKNPRDATLMLGVLARKCLPEISVHVLSAMQAGRIEVNVYHCSAAI
ncbi:unnamed protein product, partial [Polarella glacialis]